MINDCMDEKIDMIITKSISRFARNTLDTLKYVRVLKKGNVRNTAENMFSAASWNVIFAEVIYRVETGIAALFMKK